MHLPRLLIFPDPRVPLGSGKVAVRLEGFASQLALQNFPISPPKLIL